MLIKFEDQPQLYDLALNTLKREGIIALPTDTIYGLAVDGTNIRVIEKLMKLKGRQQKPFTFFLPPKKLEDFCQVVKHKIIEYFIPGPLTVILRKRNDVFLPLVTDKVGIRIPQIDFIIKLLNGFDAPLAVTSANYSGSAPLTSAQEIQQNFPDIELIIDAGSLSSKPSTIIDLTSTPPLVVRKGTIPVLEIEKIYGRIVHLAPGLKFNVLFICSGNTCRSPMAEGLLKMMINEEYCSVRSAGILPTSGMPASIYSQEIVKKFGGSISGHQSQSVTQVLIDWADIILVMGYKHYNYIVENFSSATLKTFLLKEYKRRTKYTEIPDPVGRDKAAYEATALAMIPSLKFISRDIKRRFKKI